MKVLEFHDLQEEDSLWFDFEATIDPDEVWESALDPFLQALEKHAGEWMPDVIQGRRKRKYNRTSIWKSLEEERWERGTSIGLYRTRWPALDMALSLNHPPPAPNLDITVNVMPLSFFTEAKRCNQFVELVRAWASRYPGARASAHSVADNQLSGESHPDRNDRFDKIHELNWLSVFSLKQVEAIGRERVLSTPAHRVEALPNGSVLLVTWPTAADFASDGAREAQARAHVHLRPDLDLDTVLRTLHARSATLAPVEPRFPPDVAPLLSRVVDTVGIHERQRKIAELNAWRPPEPDEWVPSSDALPPDVADPERVIAHYGLLAEHLVAMLHSEVPSIFTQAPESLSDADFYLWREDFPRTRPRPVLDEHVAPAIGAYLGQVLVEHLGGQWLPRKKLGEAQVRVGQRVWWPMVRALRYLRSQQSLLDFSLTQLYRAAERHRS